MFTAVRLTSLDDLLSTADYVSLHLPLTDETRGLVDAGRLSLMKPSAVLINAARGGLVDEAALVAALSGRRPRGAALVLEGSRPEHIVNPKALAR